MGHFKVGELTVEAGTTVLMKGSNSPQVYSVLSGLGTRSKMLEDAKWQVINFLLEGDFIGLQAEIMGEMKHSVETSTKILCVLNRSGLWDMFKAHPSRGWNLKWMADVRERFLRATSFHLAIEASANGVRWPGCAAFTGFAPPTLKMPTRCRRFFVNKIWRIRSTGS